MSMVDAKRLLDTMIVALAKDFGPRSDQGQASGQAQAGGGQASGQGGAQGQWGKTSLSEVAQKLDQATGGIVGQIASQAAEGLQRAAQDANQATGNPTKKLDQAVGVVPGV